MQNIYILHTTVLELGLSFGLSFLGRGSNACTTYVLQITLLELGLSFGLSFLGRGSNAIETYTFYMQMCASSDLRFSASPFLSPSQGSSLSCQAPSFRNPTTVASSPPAVISL